MLFLKLRGSYHALKPFLVFLNFMPEVVTRIGIEGKDIISSDIAMDEKIVDKLRQI
jgi:hypothetical protein